MNNAIDSFYHENQTTSDERAVLCLNSLGIVSVYVAFLAASGK